MSCVHLESFLLLCIVQSSQPLMMREHAYCMSVHAYCMRSTKQPATLHLNIDDARARVLHERTRVTT